MLLLQAQLSQFMTLAHYLLLPFVTTTVRFLFLRPQLDVRVVFITVTLYEQCSAASKASKIILKIVQVTSTTDTCPLPRNISEWLLHKESRAAGMKIERLKAKLSSVIEKRGVPLDSTTTSDLSQIMAEEESEALKGIQPGTFQYIFWQQQKEAAAKDSRGMRWHPVMIKWALFLKHQSSTAYETIRQSGCIHLPSQRTLRDYSQCVKSLPGFSKAVDEQLSQAASLTTCEAYKKLVVILIDEMYLREDLVYEKQLKKLVGFVNLGDINTHLLAFERSLDDTAEDLDDLAKTVVVFMVCGIFSKLRFPYAQFPCLSVTGDLLYHPFWTAVFRLERMEFKVIKLLMNNYDCIGTCNSFYVAQFIGFG